MSEEEFCSSPTDRLEFSTDTLAFDTIISGVATNTYTFQVFNRNDRALRIASVRLARGSESPFTVNVDGTWLQGGVSTNDFTVSRQDSLRVFVQLNAPITGAEEPQAFEEDLLFTLESGAQQKVLLTASSQDVNVMHGEVITDNTAFTSRLPYQIFDSLVVAEGATLTLTAGTRLYFHPDASLIVHGKLRAEGTLEQPVTFRGDRLGNMFDGQPYDRIPGQWGGIRFTKSSLGNDLTFCDVHSGTHGIILDSTGTATQKLIIDNSVIHNMAGDAFSATYCQAFVGNCQISNAHGSCVNLQGGDYTFVHCTIGQFYPFIGGHDVALRFTNTANDEPLPLERCQFFNTLISGYNDDDIMGEASERYTDCAFNYFFKNCLLNTPKVESEAIVDCLFEDTKDYDYAEKNDSTKQAGNFYPEFDIHALVFPFTLNAKSRAVDAGDPSVTFQSGYFTDLLGHPRTADGRPDIGAYEAAKEDETNE